MAISPSMVCQHREWTSRKIDAAEGVDGNAFRDMVASGGGGGDDMPLSTQDADLIINRMNSMAKAGNMDAFFIRALQILEADADNGLAQIRRIAVQARDAAQQAAAQE
jgi:hypothetical protein